jgi:hypothetical protein
METLRFNGQRSQNTLIITFIQWMAYTFYVIVNYFQYNPSFPIVFSSIIDTHLKLSEILSHVLFMIAIAQNLTFMQWFRRAYYNLHQKVNSLAYTDRWAVAGWFVPVINLYRPFVIMKELYVETERILEQEYFIKFKRFNIRVLFLWWIVYSICTLIGWATIYYIFNLENSEDLEIYYNLDTISRTLLVIFYLLHLKIIRDYSALESLWKKFEDKKQTDEYDLDENE